MNLISIVVPVYNVEQYLSYCIDTIIQQDYSNIEIILVDDGSTDSSGKICEKYAEKDKRIKVIHKQNGGLSDARNAGINIASGEYIGFVDSDDWIEKDMYSCLIHSMIENDTDIAICGFYREFKDKRIDDSEFDGVCYSDEEALRKLIDGTQIRDHACTKLYKTKLWENIRYPVGKSYEDIRTTYKLFLKSNRISVVNKPLYHYRQRSGSISKAGLNDKKIEWIHALEEQKAYFIKNQILDNDFEDRFEKKRLYIEGCLLREWLICSNTRNKHEYKNEANKYYADIKSNAKIIKGFEGFPQSIKIIARFSILPLSFINILFNNPIMNRYFSTTYNPYN